MHEFLEQFLSQNYFVFKMVIGSSSSEIFQQYVFQKQMQEKVSEFCRFNVGLPVPFFECLHRSIIQHQFRLFDFFCRSAAILNIDKIGFLNYSLLILNFTQINPL